MIIHTGTTTSTIKTRQPSLESGQSSESDSSHEAYDHLSYIISAVDTSPENLAGEEVVSIRSEDIACDTVVLQMAGEDMMASHVDEVERAVFCLQAQGSAQNLVAQSPRINGAIFNSSAAFKRKLGPSEDSANKRRRIGEDAKVTVVHPIKSGIRHLNGILPNSNGNTASNGRTVYKCPTCDKTFDTDKYLSMHLSLHKYPDNSKETFDSLKQQQRILQQQQQQQQQQQHLPQQQQQSQQTTHGGDFKMVKIAKNSAVLTTLDTRKSAVPTPPSPQFANNSTSGQWVCPYCQKTFVQNSNFKNHVRTHSDERPFVCDICSIGFKERYHLKKHVLFKHTSDLKETCRICGKCFKDSTAVRAHERIHSELRPYGCTLCGKTFKTSECLWHHENRSKTCGKAILAKQQNASNMTNVQSSSQPDTTQKKQRRSKLSASLEAKSQNEMVNSDRQTNVVLMDPVCFEGSIVSVWTQIGDIDSSQRSKQDSVKSTVDIESIKHCSKKGKGQKDVDDAASSEQRPYKCKLCGNAFKLKVHLKKHHLYRHTNEYPCECSICGKRFKDTSAVRLHERIHSSDRPFKCICGKSFKTRENLWGHKNRGPCDSKAIVAEEDGKPQLLNLSSTVLENMARFDLGACGITTFNDQLSRVKIQRISASSFITKPITTSDIAQSSNSTVKTASFKQINTYSENQPQTSGETCLPFQSTMTIPTAVVAPMCRSQSKTVQMTGSQGRLTNSVSRSMSHINEEAKRCPTIQNLLLSKGNKLIQATGPMVSSINHLDSAKEPRVLKLYNPPTDTLAILIPTDSAQQFSLLDLNPPVGDNSKQEEQRIPTLNTLMMCDFLSDPTETNHDVQSQLSVPENEIGDIFDFQVGDIQDSSFMSLRDVSNCGPMPGTLDDLGQLVHSSGFDDMGVSGWSSDSSWFLGDDASFLDDVRLPEIVPTIFSQ